MSAAASAAEDPNYRACLSGSASCDRSQLTVSQRVALDDSLRRNYCACLSGNKSCNRSLLTVVEAAAVAGEDQKRKHQRSELLVPAPTQPGPTPQAAHALPASTLKAPKAASHSSYGPPPASPSPTVTPTAQRSPPVARSLSPAPTPSPTPAAAPACAENGSCYGDTSEATGGPKTVHVKGHYKKDGTYVRGHYRSKPRK